MDSQCLDPSKPYCNDKQLCADCTRDDQCDGEMVCLESDCRTVYVIDCESPYGVITRPEITIISPGYPGPYSRGSILCETTITFENKVLLTFENFDVSSHSFCQDWVEVRDGDSSESEMIGERLCGNILPDPMESTGKSITLVFNTTSGYYIDDTGFRILAQLGKNESIRN